jgi:sulfonate transport system permease protein
LSSQKFIGKLFKPTTTSFHPKFHPESLLFLIPLTLLIGGWELSLRLGFISEKVLPSPFMSLHYMLLNMANPSFMVLIMQSMVNLLFGLIFGGALAIPLAIGTGLKHRLDSTFTPLIMIVGALPDIALLPLVIYWFGAGLATIVIMATIVAFFPIFFMVREGVKSIPQDYFHVVNIYGTKWYHLYTKLVFPAISSHTLTGVRLAYEFLWEVVLAVEIIARVSGVGLFIDLSVRGGNLTEGFAALFAIGFIAIVVDRLLFQRLENRVRRWMG